MDKVKFLEMVRKKSAYSMVRLIFLILQIVSQIIIFIFVSVGIAAAFAPGGQGFVLIFTAVIGGFFALVFVIFSYQLSLVFLDIGDATMHSAYVQHISVMRTATKEL